MTRSDLQILFSALGFLAVVMKCENTNIDSTVRASALAKLIEKFCQTTRPELFEQQTSESEVNKTDRLIETLKENLEYKQEAALPSDLHTLHQLYKRLLQRHRAYATDDLIADEVLHLLEEENRSTAHISSHSFDGTA